jgi:hypothetical protein
MQMSTRTWMTCVATVAAAAAMAAGAAAAPSGNYYGVCGKLAANGKTLTVRTVNVRCPAGRALVTRLAKMPSPGANRNFPGTYSGMGCRLLVRGGSSIFCMSLAPFRQVVGVLGR